MLPVGKPEAERSAEIIFHYDHIFFELERIDVNTEQKQSINLSAFAITVLRGDIEQFAPGMTMTGFLNAVIERYSGLADASVHASLLRRQAELAAALDQDDLLSSELTSEQRKRVIHLLDAETESRLLDESRLYESGKTFTFRLNNRNRENFFGNEADPCPELAWYGGYFSRYLKALVEEYCSLPLFSREEVFFHEYLDLVEDAVNAARIVRIEMVSPLTGNESWDVRPFGIHPDPSRMYHYLIGKSVRAGGPRRDEKIASIRLSRIRKLTVLNKKTSRSGMLSAAEKKEIRHKISTNTVSFLIGEEEDIVVRFSEAGKKKYQGSLFLRPPVRHIDEDGNWHFLCTSMQARAYFIRFGADALILSPSVLRESLAKTYADAAAAYRQTV